MDSMVSMSCVSGPLWHDRCTSSRIRIALPTPSNLEPFVRQVLLHDTFDRFRPLSDLSSNLPVLEAPRDKCITSKGSARKTDEKCPDHILEGAL